MHNAKPKASHCASLSQLQSIKSSSAKSKLAPRISTTCNVGVGKYPFILQGALGIHVFLCREIQESGEADPVIPVFSLFF